MLDRDAVQRNLEVGSNAKLWKTLWRTTKVFYDQRFIFSMKSSGRKVKLIERTLNAADVQDIALNVAVHRVGRSIAELWSK